MMMNVNLYECPWCNTRHTQPEITNNRNRCPHCDQPFNCDWKIYGADGSEWGDNG